MEVNETGTPVSSPKLIVLGALSPTSQWYEELPQHLPCEILLSTVDEIAANVPKMLDDTGADALLAPYSAAAEDLFRYIAVEEDGIDRPLLVYVENMPDEACLNGHADLIVQANAPLIARNLRSALRLRNISLDLETELTRTEDELKNFERKLEEHHHIREEVDMLKISIMKTVRHEIVSAFLGMRTFVEEMNRYYRNLPEDDVERRKEFGFMPFALDSMSRMDGIIRNLVHLTGGLRIQPRPFRLIDAVTLAQRSLTNSWNTRNLVHRVNYSIPRSLPYVIGDAQPVSVVLYQLVENALKFSEEAVLVSAVQEEAHVAVSVRDYGIGISTDHRKRIFDSFYQVDSRDNRQFQGMGVGLSIVKMILDQIGSPIDIDSTPNEGSCFTFRLQITSPKSEAERKTSVSNSTVTER